MPLTFTITREDMLRSKTIAPGWHKARVKTIEQKQANTDGSTNTVVNFVLLEGAFKDVPVSKTFSEKAPGFAIPFFVACGANVDPEKGATLDAEKCINKTIGIYIENGMYQNRPTNDIKDYRKLDVAAA